MPDESSATQTATADCSGRLYPRLLGAAWNELAAPVQMLHSSQDSVARVGLFRVRRGERWLARLLAWMGKAPAAGQAVFTRLVVAPNSDGQIWQRNFAGNPLVTFQRESPAGVLAERFGRLEFRFKLCVSEHALCFQQVGASLYLGRLAVPLPRWLAPQVAARAWAEANSAAVQVAVRISLPLAGLLVAYEGSMESEESKP